MHPLQIATQHVILSRSQSPVAQTSPTWSAPKMSQNAPPIRHKATPLWFTRLHISSSTPSIWRWMRYGDLRICRRLTTATGSGLRMKKRNTFHCFKNTCNSAVTATVISWPMMGFGRFVPIHACPHGAHSENNGGAGLGCHAYGANQITQSGNTTGLASR